MTKPSRKSTFLVLLAILLAVAIMAVPDSFMEEIRAWFQEAFGEGYQRYVLGFFIVGAAILLLRTTDKGNWLWPAAKPAKPERYNIPPGPTTRAWITEAKTHISLADPDKALRFLSQFQIEALDAEIDLLSSRLATFQQTKRKGVESLDQENRSFNRISRDVLDLVLQLEKELATGTENYKAIKTYLKKRYTNRLDQKLASRQPVNLRRLVNTEVIPEGNKPALVAYKSPEVSGAMLQTFRDARGRLLLVGAPGAGKTTLMLQLARELLDAEPDYLPAVLNLTTWSKEYSSLEAWLNVILAAEIGVSEKYAAEIIRQNHLIPLFDGFDEIEDENRRSCLEAINRFGEEGTQQYAISSRTREFQAVNQALLIHLPVEVCPLSLGQLKSELIRLRDADEKPERGAGLLLNAIDKDGLLREAIQTPFYFNTLQTLFNAGRTLDDLNFAATTLEGRQVEITDRFVQHELKVSTYPPDKANHWLSFFASRMSERNMAVFELRDLQYDWWRWRWSKWQNNLISEFFRVTPGYLVSGLILGVGLSLEYGPFIGSLIGLFFGLLLGLSSGLTKAIEGKEPQITTKDKRNWSWSNYIKHLKSDKSFVGILIYMLLFGLVKGLISEEELGLEVGLLGGIFLGLVVGLASGFAKLMEDSFDILQPTSPYHRFNASMKALWFSILQHKFLCYQLRKQGLLPPDLVKFLNEMSIRHLMEFDGDPQTGRGGAAWRFRHRILQEYFAARWTAPKEIPQPDK
ncbi:MAG: hypothetical protein KDD14_07675 [Saprospiraceae bacterium]|nr:hypothetical protein [Saprospiraceae bacterium]